MSKIYLIPCPLAENAMHTIPEYVLDAVKDCGVIFAENEKTARRFLKLLDKQIVIDDFEWFTMHKMEEEQISNFQQKMKANQNIAILSEAGCPGIADPGQILVAAAHKGGAEVIPLVGPSSILLALMASGLNGQNFEFCGYLPIDNLEKTKKIKLLEQESRKNNCTKIFIETPYRNNTMIDSLLNTLQGDTLLCIAANLTGANEKVQTKTVTTWKNKKPDLHKQPVIFLFQSGK